MRQVSVPASTSLSLCEPFRQEPGPSDRTFQGRAAELDPPVVVRRPVTGSARAQRKWLAQSLKSVVKEFDDDNISSNFADTVARITHRGGADRQVDLSAAEILNVAGVHLVIPLFLDSPGGFAKLVGEADGNCWNYVWDHGAV